MSLYRIFIRPILFLFDAETAHRITFAVGKLFFRSRVVREFTSAIYTRGLRSIPTRFGALELSNPIGLAAGFDKNAVLVPGLECLGFGFVEIGTVTPRPQAGNPRPRLFREKERRAIVNRMGFNNAGAEEIALHLKNVKRKIQVPLGINLGKNKDTPNSSALSDYDSLLKTFRELADYFVINVSSPNTPGLRNLQSLEFISNLGERIHSQRIIQPVFVKLGPDLAVEDLKDLCNLCGAGKYFTGLILTNTIPTDLGGLSGYPLRGPSIQSLKTVRTFLPKEVPIISVGGIETAQDAFERLSLGATAIQIYSTLIYQGPSAVRQIRKGLQELLTK